MPDIGINAEKSDKVKALRDKLSYKTWMTRLVGIELDRAEMEKRAVDLANEEASLKANIADYEKKYPNDT